MHDGEGGWGGESGEGSGEVKKCPIRYIPFGASHLEAPRKRAMQKMRVKTGA